MKRRLAKGFLDALEFPLKDFRNPRKDINILDRNDRKPHSLPADEPRAFRDISHAQVAVHEILCVVIPQGCFEVRITIDSPPKSPGDSIHGQIIVRWPYATCGK